MNSEMFSRNSWLESNFSDHRPSNLLPQLNENLREHVVSIEPSDILSSSASANVGYTSSDLGLAPRTSFITYLTSALGTGLVEHRFIHLTQYSVFRAYLANASVLSLPQSLLLDEDAFSPYTVLHPFSAITTPLTHTLNPTDIQLSTYHHPYIDLIASPSLRNNVLTASLDKQQEDALCMDLHIDGFTVWGSQPWNFMGWEVAQAFTSKWAWLLDEDTIRYSNFWRAERGELPLQVPTLCGFV